MLRSSIGLNESNNMTRKRICDNLQTVFSTKSSPVSLHIFGSSINGLGVKGCDLDVYVDLLGKLSLYLYWRHKSHHYMQNYRPAKFKPRQSEQYYFNNLGIFWIRTWFQLVFADSLNISKGSSQKEQSESEKANKVAHILRSTERDHSIRKVIF